MTHLTNLPKFQSSVGYQQRINSSFGNSRLEHAKPEVDVMSLGFGFFFFQDLGGGSSESFFFSEDFEPGMRMNWSFQGLGFFWFLACLLIFILQFFVPG